MKISFCTTCMNRVHHLRETLPNNITNNPSVDGIDVEFVVLNYNSQDGMHEWMMNDPLIAAEMEAGRLVYARTTEPQVFRMSHAKNMAHRVASGDVLCNLDADNYTGPNFAQALADLFEKEKDIVVSPSFRVSRYFPAQERGFVGRIAVGRNNFYALGGYNEQLQGWGGDDTDFTRRAKMAGLHHIRFENLEFLNVIGHSHQERIANMATTAEERERLLRKVLAKKGRSIIHELANAAKARLETLVNPVTANEGVRFGMGRIQEAGGIPRTIGTHRDFHRQFVKASGLLEVVRGRVAPRTISLGSNRVFALR